MAVQFCQRRERPGYQAVQFTGGNDDEIREFTGGDVEYAHDVMLKVTVGRTFAAVLSPGDWVLKDGDGCLEQSVSARFAEEFEPTSK
jgi:sarcosine oxidase gamma subunit